MHTNWKGSHPYTVGRQDKANMCYAVSTRSNPEKNDGVDECAVPRFY